MDSPITDRHTPPALVLRRNGTDDGFVKKDHPTVDTSMVYRCLLVGLDDASAEVCSSAIRPLQAVVVTDVGEACQRISEVLPLILVLPEGGKGKTRMPELIELADACGAEVITVSRPPDTATLGHQILDALRKGEARRVPK